MENITSMFSDGMLPSIAYVSEPTPDELSVLGAGIEQFSQATVGPGDRQSLTFLLRHAEGSVIGGVHGNTERGWLYVSALWVAEAYRRHGYGAALLRQAECQALRRGCRQAYLDTMSYQAPQFYQRQGYVVFGELDGFPPPHRRIFLRKTLSDE